HLRFGNQRIDGFQPLLWTANLADVADGAELPQRPLPGGNVRGERGGIARLRSAPAGAEAVEEERRLLGREAGPKRAKILGIQAAFARDAFNGLAFCLQGLALSERRVEILLQRQASALVGVKNDSLEIHLVAAT